MELFIIFIIVGILPSLAYFMLLKNSYPDCYFRFKKEIL